MTDKPIEVTEADREAAAEWGFILNHRESEYEGCPVADLAEGFAQHRIQSTQDLTQQLQEAREENARLQSFVDKLKSSIGFNHNLRDCVTAKKTLTPNMFAYLAIHKVFEHLDALTTKADGGS